MNARQLKGQLKQLGITEAIAAPVKYDGSQAIELRWNGDTEYFFGIDYLNPIEADIQESRIERFKDVNL